MVTLSFLLMQALLAAPSSTAANLEGRLLEVSSNKTLLNTEFFTGWNDAPVSRGTSEILWSCLVTLAACVYTAIHLNIPIRHRTKWERVGAKVKWALLALVAPELVVGMALTQYLEAKRLCSSLNKIGNCNNKDNATPQSDEEAAKPKNGADAPTCQLPYGFWVIMGGFVVDVKDMHNETERVVLKSEGVELLAREGFALSMPLEQIADRSKANLLAKFLVCIQVVWMLVQCIARKALGYPLALLEVHTMVHVGCALAIYLLWWHKPLDVEEPVVVDCSQFKDLIALMLMEDFSPNVYPNTGAEFRILNFINHSLPEPDASVVCAVKGLREDLGPRYRQHDNEHGISVYTDQEQSKISTMEEKWLLKTKIPVVTLQTGQFLRCGFGPGTTLEGALISMQLSAADIYRWEQGAEALRKLDQLPSRYEDDSDSYAYRAFNWESTRYHGCNDGITAGGARNIEMASVGEATGYERALTLALSALSPFLYQKAMLYTGLGILPFFYGGFHLTAWHFAFATPTEALLWKVACLGIMAGSPLAAAVLHFSVHLLSRKMELGMFLMGLSLIGALVALFLPLFAFCRIFIVLEAFLSLRSVPVGVYASISWLQNLPHL